MNYGPVSLIKLSLTDGTEIKINWALELKLILKLKFKEMKIAMTLDRIRTQKINQMVNKCDFISYNK